MIPGTSHSLCQDKKVLIPNRMRAASSHTDPAPGSRKLQFSASNGRLLHLRCWAQVHEEACKFRGLVIFFDYFCLQTKAFQ